MARLGVLLVAFACVHAVGAASIRGLNPDKASLYTGADGTFTCIDGSQRIAFSRVNDNYCDCFDGSDEPGTSACSNGQFYCANRGHEPRLLAAAFVDDGICDCCDGADERGCPHTCLDQSSGLVQELETKMQSYQVALSNKQAAIQAGKSRREGWSSRIHTISADVEAKEAEVKAAVEAKAHVDQIHQERLAAQDLAREEAKQRWQAEHDEKARKLAEEQAQAAANAVPEEGQQEAATEQEAADSQGETVEERGRRIASQWTTDPDAAAAAEGADEEAPEEAHEDEPLYEPEEPQHTDEDDEVVQQLREATQQLEAAEAQLAALKKEQQDITYYSTGSHDFGPADTFFSLAGRCFEERQSTWVYEVCFFDRASQSESSGSKVSLGTWKGFSLGLNTVAEFGDGDACPNVPGRSLRVQLVCGAYEQLSKATEPSTCSYEMQLETPLACSDAEFAQITKRLLDLELQRRQIQEEISAAHDEL